jgi:hypothetical protein
MLLWVVAISSIITFLLTMYLFYNYAPKNMSKQVQVLLISNWYLIFQSVAFLPIDIYIVSI